ncbi:MAG: heparin lyase I family protein [Pseudomonadota bacterium]
MKRRSFLVATSAFLSTSLLPEGSNGQVTQRAERVSLTNNRRMSAGRSYSYQRIADPTGRAPTDRVERFELRGGDCPRNNDCTPRPFSRGLTVKRTRTEKIITTRMRDGDEGLYRYWLFLPSSEFNFVDSVNSAFGQLLAARGRGNSYDSFPIFLLDTGFDNPGSRISAWAGEALENELDEQRSAAYDFGNYKRDAYLRDNWFQVEVRFRLSSGNDGYIQPRVNGKTLGRFEGKTILRRGYLEIRYGIYQTGTNFYPGGAKAVPTQVALFSGVELFKLV